LAKRSSELIKMHGKTTIKMIFLYFPKSVAKIPVSFKSIKNNRYFK
jgi:hypothetical protein